MEVIDWMKEFGAAITVCDRDGAICAMNESAAAVFEKEGGARLIGSDVFACHPQKAKEKLADLMNRQVANCYTIEKNGRKKLIYQAPWYKDGQYQGFVELSLPLPPDMPHFVRS
ncbi:MAG: hypothetical protein JW795_18530 [Chitinivibrionales bacterium]|nr:hypothetical protein [Chitinivibrionales bacterium]